MNASSAPTPVVVGVIDDGLCFAHERFRKVVNHQVETRVENCWIQDGTPKGAPPPVPYGRELRKAEIDLLLVECTRAGAVDEDLIYRKAGLIDFRQYGHKSAAWRASHGTHVMDLACGFEPGQAQPENIIICVQLPTRVTAATSGAGLYPYVFDAITYILACTAAISKERGLPHLPVVINLSYGRLAGPHDGTLNLERAIDNIVAKCAARGVSLQVTLPAGNSYLSRCHAQLSFQRRGQTRTLHWRVLPDDQTPSFIEIWMPARNAGSVGSRIQIRITSPTGESRTIDETIGAVQWGPGNRVYAKASYSIAPASQRGIFMIALAPTFHLDPSKPLAPCGTWTLEIKNLMLSRKDIPQAWIQRDDSLYGFPTKGRQSHFDEPCYERYDHAGRDNEVDDPGCVVRREGTVNGIATGEYPIVIGGYLRDEMVAAKYSAAGVAGSMGSTPRSPDAVAVSEDSRVRRGILAAGTRSGSVVAIGGTSTAAPQVARWCALELASGNLGNRASVQAKATQDEANHPAGTPAAPSHQRSGKGRLDLPSSHPRTR